MPLLTYLFFPQVTLQLTNYKNNTLYSYILANKNLLSYFCGQITAQLIFFHYKFTDFGRKNKENRDKSEGQNYEKEKGVKARNSLIRKQDVVKNAQVIIDRDTLLRKDEKKVKL